MAREHDRTDSDSYAFTRLSEFIDDVEYPAHKHDIIRVAQKNDAPNVALRALDELPDRVYTSFDALRAELQQLAHRAGAAGLGLDSTASGRGPQRHPGETRMQRPIEPDTTYAQGIQNQAADGNVLQPRERTIEPGMPAGDLRHDMSDASHGGLSSAEIGDTDRRLETRGDRGPEASGASGIRATTGGERVNELQDQGRTGLSGGSFSQDVPSKMNTPERLQGKQASARSSDDEDIDDEHIDEEQERFCHPDEGQSPAP